MRPIHLNSKIALIGFVIAMLPATRARAVADAFTYSSIRRQIRVGVVVTHALDIVDPGNGNPLGSENPDPHIFYVLDSRTDLKPLGLEFVNPHAPAVLTGDIYNRWQTRQMSNAPPDPAFVAGTPQSRVFTVGSKVTKNMGAYWEANIDNLSPDDLQQYDLLLITSHKLNISFGSELKEKLRRFVDAGGTLWIDNCGRATFDPLNPVWYEVAMNAAYLSPYGVALGSFNHPMTSYPFRLSTQEIQALGDKRYGDYYLYDQSNPANPVPGGQLLTPVIWNTRGTPPINIVQPGPTWRPLTLAGQVGAGKMVFSMQDFSCKINDYVGGPNIGYGGNSAAISGEIMAAANPADLKIVYNLAVWSAANSTGFQNVRRNGQSSEKIGSVLVDKWAAPLPPSQWPPAPPQPATYKVGGAVYFKNCVYSIDGALVLHCYDAKPGSDLDGDGNPDDGLPDLIAGAPYDEVWRLPLRPLTNGATGASTPTVFEFYDPNYIANNGPSVGSDGPGPAVTLANFNFRELVVVTMSDGTVIAVRALPRVANGKLPLAPSTKIEWTCSGYAMDFGIDTTPQSGAGGIDPAQDVPIPAPAWSEGVVFAAVNTTNGGRVIAIDPHAGLSSLTPGPNGYGGDAFFISAVPDVASAAQMPTIHSSPSVAYVRDVINGAIDRVVYVFTQRAAGGGANVPPMIRAFWFNTKGETLSAQNADPLDNVNPKRFASRADKPWFVFDPAAPGNGNPLHRQRIWYTFRDTDGTYFSKEFIYDNTAGPAAPVKGAYKIQIAGNQTQIILNPQQDCPKGVVNTSDGRNTFFADYNIDWVVDPAKAYKITQRSFFPAPENPTVSSQIGGPPAISPDDVAFFTVRSIRPLANTPPGAGVLYGVKEQYPSRSNLKWAFLMHDGFTIRSNGQDTEIPPRMRQMDPALNFLAPPLPFGNFIKNVEFVGTPAYKDGVVYATAVGRAIAGNPDNQFDVSLLLAFRANPNIVLHLNSPIDPGAQIRVRQINILTTQGFGGLIKPPPTYVDMTPAQYTIDYGAGTIHVTSCSPPGNVTPFVSTSVPFLVQVGNGQEQMIFGTQTDNISPGNQEVRMIGPRGVDNLLWYTVIPRGQFTSGGVPVTLGLVASSPNVQGDNIWIGFQLGYIGSFPTDPQKTYPAFQAPGSHVPLIDPLSQRDILWVRQVYNQVANLVNGGAIPSVTSAPASNANVLFINTFNGITTLEDTFTVVADSKRLVEVNAGGEAVWSSDSSRTFGVAGGALPEYVFDPATGNVIIGNNALATGSAVVRNTQFSKPTVARRIGSNDLLVVDTGNNRVVQIDRGGNVVWEVSRLFDDYRKALRPGDPTTLNEPTDVQFWQDFDPNLNIAIDVNGTVFGYIGPAYIVHYLISDTGNFRVIELVDVYDPQGNPVVPTNGGNAAPFAMLRQVNFVSSSYGLQGARYRYRSVQRLVLRNGDLQNTAFQNLYDAAQPVDAIRLLTLSAISNARLAGLGPVGQNLDDPVAAGQLFQPGGGGGSLVVMNEAGNPGVIVSNLRIPTGGASFRSQAIVNPTWFSAFTELGAGGTLQIKYLLADDNGCYQMAPGIDVMTGQPVMNVEWLITTDDYYRMTGKRLKPSSVRRLVSAVTVGPNTGLHRFLISNRFSGEDNPSVFGVPYNISGIPANGNIRGPSEFHGEVFELDPTNFDITVPGHGYVPDYFVIGNFLQKSPIPSIVWRTPTEAIPDPLQGQIGFIRRFIGDPNRATSTAVLEQPAYGDRPY